MICQMCGKKLQDIRHGADAKGFYCPQCSKIRFPKLPNNHREAIIAELEDLERWVVNPGETVDWVTVTVEIRRRIEFLKGGPAKKEGGDAQ